MAPEASERIVCLFFFRLADLRFARGRGRGEVNVLALGSRGWIFWFYLGFVAGFLGVYGRFKDF